ncbi:type VI secretion protein [Intrasporangium chromatireducens Q5-1]|uniref:Type VI secretion protein n=1 Tax=Intrasporangium chromatireducens Q5-1 TaxID=584657 RepID=W9GPQ7_9MICO|nr:TraM recognition domain-containing protein [Intrasporangium chromatireducens]EWT06818.1 type VI secretion protein [Intrasporangium chromatireducens Q5-1]
MPRSETRSHHTDLQLVIIGAALALLVLLWGAAAASAGLTGTAAPPFTIVAPLAAFGHPANPSLAWGSPVGPAWLYWSLTVLALALPVAGWLIAKQLRSASPHVIAAGAPTGEGMAGGVEVRRAAGKARLLKQAPSLRPCLTKPAPNDLGHLLGRSRGIACYCTVEDSIVVLGPPRSGKGLHLVIPALLDASGAVVSTSTRPDNLTATLRTRESRGPVAVFDPQGLAPGIPSRARWSPIRGCQDPHIAMVRAKALTAGAANGTTDSNFWQASAELAVRALLHAAALGGCTPTDLYRWSLSAVHAREAVMILASNPQAAPSWHQGLDSIVTADPRQRDSVWAMVAIAFAALADPKVLDAVSPTGDEHLDPAAFLTSAGTIYLLGTSTGSAATAGLVGAFLEDILETARRHAAASPNARLDPPLSLILDEAANYPLPSLASLMSDGGGSGISTTVVLQSLAQARAVWGEHAASAIWDAAIVKVILGGGSNARDLEDLSKLIGTRSKQTTTVSTGGDGRRSTSTHTADVPVLDPSQLRTLPFGQSILLLRSARPIALTMQPWTARRDAKALQGDRERLERAIQHAHTQRL